MQECCGMTDLQYKGMLIDQLRVWEELSVLVEEGSVEKIRDFVEEEIRVIQMKLGA